MKRITTCLLPFIFLLNCALHAQVSVSPQLEQRVSDVMSLFRVNPQNYKEFFSSGFLSQVPDSKLTEIFTYYYTNLGKCIKANPDFPVTRYSGKFFLIFEKDMSVPINITVDESEPHLITGLWIGAPVAIAGSFSDVVNEFKNLPGRSTILILKVSGNRPDTLASYNADSEMAIGSAFKLYVLSELLHDVNKGRRKWSDVVNLRAEDLSLPSGILQKWPVGSPLTLHTLAALMISQSDNTAADGMIRLLGRKNIENILPVTGHSNPGLDIPFPSTSELFKLKGERGMRHLHKYLSLNTEGRRELLNDAVSRIDLDSLTIPSEPAYIDSVEWFASAADLCRDMNWIRLNSKNEPGAEARKILSINPGLTLSKNRWKYIGYKGGSEPGVMNMTYLLQSVKGDWYLMSAGWNNSKAPLDENKFIGLVGGAIKLIK